MKLKKLFIILCIIFSQFFNCGIMFAQTSDDKQQSGEKQERPNYLKELMAQLFVEAILENKYYNEYISMFSEAGLSVSDRQKIIEEFLFKLVGAENIKEDSRGAYINAKHLAVVEYYMDEEFYSTAMDKVSQINPRNPNIVAGAQLESIYESVKALAYSEFLLKSLVSDLIKNIKPHLNVKTNELEWNFDKVIKILDEESEKNPEAGRERIYNFGAWALGFGYFNHKSFFNPYNDDCFYTHFTKNDRELKWMFDSIGKIPYDLSIADPAKQGDEAVRADKNIALTDFHARRGNDVVYGSDLNDSFIGGTGNDFLDGGDGNDNIFAWAGDDIIWGGNGNDVIFAGEGNDIIFAGDGDDIIYTNHQDYKDKKPESGNNIVNAGKGNDRIYSVNGNDTYIYAIGDGNDIIDDKYGEDMIYFQKGIHFDFIKPERVKNDLVLYIESDNGQIGSITIKNNFKRYWLKKNKDMSKIEYIKVDDLGKIPVSYIFDIIRTPDNIDKNQE